MGQVDDHASAHGGITFSEADLPCDKGGKDDAWWIGFDCGHAWDAIDPNLPIDPELHPDPDRWRNLFLDAEEAVQTSYPMVLRTQEYVESECRSLCVQAAAAQAGKEAEEAEEAEELHRRKKIEAVARMKIVRRAIIRKAE